MGNKISNKGSPTKIKLRKNFFLSYLQIPQKGDY